MFVILLAFASLALGERNEVENALHAELALLSKESADLSQKAKTLAENIQGLSDQAIRQGKQGTEAEVKTAGWTSKHETKTIYAGNIGCSPANAQHMGVEDGNAVCRCYGFDKDTWGDVCCSMGDASRCVCGEGIRDVTVP